MCRYHWVNCRTNFEFWEKLCRSLNGSPRPVPAPKTIQTGSLLRGSGSDPRCQRNTFPYHARSKRVRSFAIQAATPDAREVLFRITRNSDVRAASRSREQFQMPEEYYPLSFPIRTYALLPATSSPTLHSRVGRKKIYIYIYIIFPLPNPHISFHIPLHILLPSRSFVRVRALEMYITFLSNFWADMHIESECDGVHHASKSLPGGSLVRWASQGFGPFFARPSPRLQSVAFV